MNGIQNYGTTVNFKAAKTALLNDAAIEKMVSDFSAKVMETKFSGDFEKDMLQYAKMHAESNKILHNIVEAAKDKKISYDCAKTQIKKLDIL